MCGSPPSLPPSLLSLSLTLECVKADVAAGQSALAGCGAPHEDDIAAPSPPGSPPSPPGLLLLLLPAGGVAGEALGPCRMAPLPSTLWGGW